MGHGLESRSGSGLELSLSIHIRLDVDGISLRLIIRVFFHAKSDKINELRALHPRVIGVFILRHISLLLLLFVLFGLCSWWLGRRRSKRIKLCRLLLLLLNGRLSLRRTTCTHKAKAGSCCWLLLLLLCWTTLRVQIKTCKHRGRWSRLWLLRWLRGSTTK